MIHIITLKSHLLNPKSILILILILGAFLRFYKLDWGEGIFTHPDEYHIASSVNQLSFPTQMHPHFFSYGTLSIYLIYFTKVLLSAVSLQLPAISPFIIGRFYSACFSALTIYLVYLISKKILPVSHSLIAALLVATTPGLIQQAHFATPESTLIFFILMTALFLISHTQNTHLKNLSLAAISTGCALSVKVSSFLLLLPLLLTLIVSHLRSLPPLILKGAWSLLITLVVFLLLSPFVFLDFPAFRGNLNYEGGLAAGQFPVFYTRQFIDTPPIIFQLTKIYPYALGPMLEILGIIGLVLMLITFILHRSFLHRPYLILVTTFLAFFLFNSLLFAKWTRFISPTFSFFAIFTALLLQQLSTLIPRKIYYPFLTLVIGIHLIFSLAFFSIYLKEDVRLTATGWINANIPQGSIILLEGGNMVDIPLVGNYPRSSHDFYVYEDNLVVQDEIINTLTSSDYFIVQSRRVFANHQEKLFPKTARFYRQIFSGSLGFQEVQTFSSYPGIAMGAWRLEIPDEIAEETWSVFDHPVIRVFKKTTPKTKEEYVQLLNL